ncbi:MAG: NAD(P)H-quinone oxidoreductase [Deltaproteobacteria bacterium]|nr:NAD(P)H-quinone oxidoreductase [Deltaproteobacteria bacterium]
MSKVEAVIIEGAGGPEVLSLGTLELAEPGPGEVRVEVAAAGLNRADLLQRMGLYPAPPGVPPQVPGLELAGAIVALGEGVEGWSVGERVMALTAGGAMAREANVPAGQLLPWPEGLPAAEAAAIPEAFLTAFDALILQGALRAGETLYLNALGSGVGTAAVQLASRAGATVLASSRSPEKIEAARPLGLAAGRAPGEGLAAWVRERTGGRGAEVVLDLVGASQLSETQRCLAPRGRWLLVGLLGGARAELDLGRLLAARITLTGTVLRSRPGEEKAALVQAFAAQALPGFAEGRLRPVLAGTLPMERVGEAHARLAGGGIFGKLVLTW